MKALDILMTALVIVGGLNWGLVGILNFDLVAAVLGDMSAFARIVYALVGVAAVYHAVSWKAMQRRWGFALATR